MKLKTDTTQFLSPDTVVMINLSGPGKEAGQRITVNEVVYAKDLPQIDFPDKEQPPAFPMDQISEINMDDSLSPGEKFERIQEILNDYAEVLNNFEEDGGEVLTEEMMLLLQVREHLIRNHGFGRYETDDQPYITTSDMQVTFLRSQKGETIASVSGTSVWG